ncbi:MAG TPA: prepilin-type N-terminal cleavage/methylation domain-containing protein [Candidatus Saccharimonadales bacterium]|nr:prepilin-type N-terminal cleavage/methylation domain-containing protein [Candidatus Saccharimonadales bacterium]
MKWRPTEVFRPKNQAGYTLLELIVVLIIVAILVAVLIWKNT